MEELVLVMGRDVPSGAVKFPCGLRKFRIKDSGELTAGPSTDCRVGLIFVLMTQLFTNDRSAAAQARGYVSSLIMVGASTVAGLVVGPAWGNSAVDLLFIPAVLGAAALAGLGPALLAAVASALAYNFFFTAPHFTFRIANPTDIVTVLILFGVALVTSQMAAAIRHQARLARANAARNATIASFARGLLGCASAEEVADVATRDIAAIFDCNALLVGAGEGRSVVAAVPQATSLNPNDLAAVELALATGESTGRGVDRAVPTEWQFHPVRSGRDTLAAIGIARDDGTLAVRADQLALFRNLLDQLALALERGRLEADAREFGRLRERDQLRSSLLSTIGHDMKPTLAALSQSARALRRGGTADKTVVAEIGAATAKLERYLANLAAIDPDGEDRPVVVGNVAIDLFRRSVSRDGRPVHLTPKEYGVLAELAKHQGRVLGHAHLLRAVWGPAQEKQTEYLRVAVRALRQKLEEDPSNPALIINEPSVGYRMKLAQQGPASTRSPRF